ncbi:MAG: hypothetical protein BAJATHORv1_50035 [Candidatus Thorarchaeota archaeon]|nr:MAG: hypothetical protein BAJATHORv1_50035 [Candidatus Thorarchaeota archaeon]
MRREVIQRIMVSRSLEKMMLIAVGLTTAVLVGVPVLLYAMDTLNNASQLEAAEDFAGKVHSIVNSTDRGISNDTTLQISVPTGISLSSSESTLMITFQKNDLQTITWTETYSHSIELIPPSSTGLYFLTVRLVNEEIIINFQPVA